MNIDILMSTSLSVFQDEAERWTTTMAKEGFKVTINHADKTQTFTDTKATIVTKDPAQAAPGADVVVFMMPAFAHQQYLEALKPHIKPGCVVAGLPGQAGFEFEVRQHWGDLAKQVTLLNFESLPWACRMTQFGMRAEVIGTKQALVGAVLVGSTPSPSDATAMLQSTLGAKPELIVNGHLLGMTLMGTNAYIHPSIMYGRWKDWDGQPVDEPPLFYNGLNQDGADTLSGVSDEVVASAKALMKLRPDVNLNNVVHIYDWYIRCYGDDMGDKSTLYHAVRTNGSYKGLTHPTVKTADGKYTVDYKYRYMTEDIPFGLVVMRGIADLAGVKTPNMDKVITWAQTQMGTEYLVDGKLTGKDIGKTRSPQKYNIADIDTMLGLK